MKQLLGPLGLRNQQCRPTKKEVFVHLLTLGASERYFYKLIYTCIQLYNDLICILPKIITKLEIRVQPLARPYAICACRMKRQLN